MSMTKYGAKPDQTAKTASGSPGDYAPKPEKPKAEKPDAQLPNQAQQR